MITRYVQRAMEHAQLKWLPESRAYFGPIPELRGVWATGPTIEDARAELQEILEEWIALSFSLHHTIPPVDGIDINVDVERTKAVGECSLRADQPALADPVPA